MRTAFVGARAPTPGRPGLSRANVLVLVAIVVIGGGLLLAAVTKVRDKGMVSTTVCNLKQISLAAQNFHDQFLRYPGNGTGVGDGLASPKASTDGSFLYQILPFIEQDALYRNPALCATSGVTVYAYLEPPRSRAGTNRDGPVADYAVNVLALYGDKAPPTPANTKETLSYEKITDGTSNTILVGGKALHPSDYATTDPAVDDTFLKLSSGGTSTVGARYTVGAKTVLKDLTSPPSVEYLMPTAVRDQNAERGVRTDRFGGPYKSGVLVVFCDGHVSSLSYEWLAPDKAVPIKPVTWGTPPTTGTFDSVSQFRAALIPQAGEEVKFE